MPDLYLITTSKIPETLQGAYKNIILRSLLINEKIAFEDRLFKDGIQIKLESELYALIINDISITKDIELLKYYAIIGEFSLTIISSGSRIWFSYAGSFSNGQFIFSKILKPIVDTMPIEFQKGITGTTATQWIYICLSAARSIGIERWHITTDRYLRALFSSDIVDSILDLTISLESLIDAQTEISFRFGICLSRIIGRKGQAGADAAKLFSTLYDVRSKISHGDPKSLNKIKELTPSLPDIYNLDRKVLVIYIIFVSEHKYVEWQAYLRTKLFE